MDRFASSILKVTYEGPDVHEQSLFQTFRVSSLVLVLQRHFYLILAIRSNS